MKLQEGPYRYCLSSSPGFDATEAPPSRQRHIWASTRQTPPFQLEERTSNLGKLQEVLDRRTQPSAPSNQTQIRWQPRTEKTRGATQPQRHHDGQQTQRRRLRLLYKGLRSPNSRTKRYRRSSRRQRREKPGVPYSTNATSSLSSERRRETRTTCCHQQRRRRNR